VRFSRFAVVLGVLLGSSACQKDETLGLADSYLVYEPVTEAGGAPRTSPAGLPVLKPVPVDDARVGALHAALGAGFAGEVLRTDYLVKQFVREARVAGRGDEPAAVSEAREPTIFVLSGTRSEASEPASAEPFLGVGFATEGWFGRLKDHPAAVWLVSGAVPSDDTALSQTLAGRLGRLLGERISQPAGLARVFPATAPLRPSMYQASPAQGALVEGLGAALEVIAREWRTGDGPRGALSPDAGTARQRARFADIRENRCVYVGAGTEEGEAHTAEKSLTLKAPEKLISDPCVVATVIYRLIQSKLVGRRVAPPEIYTTFAKDRVPPGVSAAAVFGPVRNALVKWTGAWGTAVLAGPPPIHLAEMISRYAESIPGEKSETYRLFVVTTYGGTIQPGGIPGGARDEAAAASLAAWAAEAAAGRKPLLVGAAP